MLLYWLWLSCMPAWNGREKIALLRHFHTPEDIYRIDRRQLRELPGITESKAKALLDKDLTKVRQIAGICERKGISMVVFSDSAYPANLRNIDDPPLVLYYLGNLPQSHIQPLIGVVGTRDASPYGLRIAGRISGQIAACGGIVVSGGAKGIDTRALVGAVAQEQRTMVFQAGGLDKLYPAENAQLFRKILEKGCILSEYPPGTASYRGNFLRRNRLISGVSDGVLVVEAPESSGALNTANWASEQGKDVFVVPGNVDTPNCKGSNALIGDIARAALDGWMVIREYQDRYPETVRKAESMDPEPVSGEILPQQPVKKKPQTDKITVDKGKDCPYSVIEKDFSAFDEQERAILEKLSHVPVSQDAVLEQLPFSSREAISVLTKLSLKGVVISHPGNLISLK